uniref:Metalloendopeptidase n=1 Tax=Globodera rostochiensis TaxID=31243 RepID=A0A914H8W2_GLORO
MILLTFWLLLIALLKTCGAHGGEPPDKIWNIRLICYQSKLAKNSGNWKVGGRFRVNNPNGSIAYECAGDGTKGWHAVRISNDKPGSNSSNYPKINPNKALTLDDQSVEADFWKSIRFGAFMRDFNGMAFQLAALEIRQFIGKKDMKLCKTKCAAKWEPQTEAPKDSSTMKISRTEPSTATTTTPVMPKAQHVNHLGINCLQIEFPAGIPKFSLNISAYAFALACKEHKNQKSAEKYDQKKDFLARANACAQVSTSKCNKSVEMLACYRSKSQSTGHRNSILAKCKLHLEKAANVAGIRVKICIHREADKQMLVVESTISFSFTEKIHNSTRKFSIKPGETPDTSLALTLVSFPIFFIEFGNERHKSFIDDKTGGKNTSSNWDNEQEAATVLNSIAEEQINGSWTKTLHFVPPPNDENMKIYFQITKPRFTKMITRQFVQPYKDNPDIIHPSLCDELGDDCEPTLQIVRKINEMQEWCAPFHPSGPCIGPRRTPTPEDLKPFMRPPWDRMAFPSTEIPRTDKSPDDLLIFDGDIIYTKRHAQAQYDHFMKACARCRNTSDLEEEPRRLKRQFLILAAAKWREFPIPIKFDPDTLGIEIESAITAVQGAVAWIMEKTCVNFTFDESNATEGIRIYDNGRQDICGRSPVGRGWGWQSISLNCRDMATAAHELLHVLGLTHEHQRNDVYSFIKLNPFEKDNAQKTENYGLPYDFGSIIHYPPEHGSYNTYKRITLNRFYQQTIGQEEKPSFKDYAIINRMYCNDSCGAENVCQNGGYPNPKRCSECFCPDGYGGKRCETLEEDSNCASLGVHMARELEADWQIRTFNPSVKCVGDYECACHWRIKPKDGKKLRIQLKQLDLQAQCSAMPCNRPFFEIKFRKDKRAQGARLCCPDAIRQMSPSQNWIETEESGTEMIISAHLNGMNNVKIELTYETGLKCGVKCDVGEKFSQDTLDEFDCVVDGHQCVYAEFSQYKCVVQKCDSFALPNQLRAFIRVVSSTSLVSKSGAPPSIHPDLALVLVGLQLRCRNTSDLEEEPRRLKRQFLILAAAKWREFPIPIKFDPDTLGIEIESAITAVQGAVAWIMEKTCVNFTFDESNATEGIRIYDNGRQDICGRSPVGRGWGWQSISLNCRDMATAAHELLHVLGLTHEHQRNDVYSFIKLNPFEKDNAQKTENYGLPYDFGSIIHYPPEHGSYNTYKRITLNRFYQQTIGQEEKPSFKDYAIINRMYCNDSCGAENVCQNGGYPNPKRCSECFCPDGYGGKRCETLEEDSNCASLGVHMARELEADWQIRTFNPSVKCVGDYECACHWRIKPKDGKKLRIQLKQLDLQAQCSAMPCNRPFFEIKFRKDKRAQGARLCCPDAIRQMSPSQNWIETEESGTEMIISAHLNGMNNVKIELTYETDGAKIVRSDECPDPRDLFIKERNPGQPVTCNVDDLKSKQIPCSRKNEIYACRLANYTALVNGRPTNKTQIFIECFKREDNPTKFWGYWEDKAQDPIHIDDIQCVQPYP